MQTPLMELIEWIKNGDDGLLWTQQDITEKATELLEKEREVIGAAYTAGGLDGVCVGIAKQNERAFSSEFDYFTKTFTDES